MTRFIGLVKNVIVSCLTIFIIMMIAEGFK